MPIEGNKLAYLSRFLDHVPLAICLIDEKKRIIFANKAFESLLGWDSAKIRGVPCCAVLRQRICSDNCPLQKEKNPFEVSLDSDLMTFFRKRINVRSTFSTVTGEKGELLAYMECLEDTSKVFEKGFAWDRTYRFGRMIGKSPAIEKVFKLLPLIAETDSPVLITGETGTGKDLLAEAIHEASGRAKGPFVKVNCGAVPETLLESELFGHEKGAFTGATESKPGRFRLAHNGTLYLTEIGDLPLSLQVKLLTFLDDKIIYPLGSTKGIKVDVRIIAATHRDLERMVKEGTFRQDLLYRLNVVRLHLPPLRERGDDLKLLVDYFVHHLSVKAKKGVVGLSQETWDLLRHYPFPGNIRELRNIIEYAVTICDESQISLNHLPPYVLESERIETLPAKVYGETAPAALGENDPNWRQVEKKMIIEALLRAKGKKGRAAAMLGWGRSTLWRKMKIYGL